MSKLTAQLQQRYVVTGDELARDALACIRALESTVNDLVSIACPAERKRGRSALENGRACIERLRGGSNARE